MSQSDAEIDWGAWQADGHKLTCEVRVGESPGGARLYTELHIDSECPEDSVCRRAREVSADYCFIREELGVAGPIDFIEYMETEGVQKDWSSGFPVTIEWIDRGEDGIQWRPAKQGEAQ